MADGKGDESQRNVADQGKGINLFKSTETDIQAAEHAGADQYAGHQVRRNVRQMKLYKETGHQQPREQGHRN